MITNDFEAVTKAIAIVMNIDAATLKLETDIIDDLGAESIDLVDIGFELERLTGLEIDLNKIRQLAMLNQSKRLRVQDFVEYIKAMR